MLVLITRAICCAIKISFENSLNNGNFVQQRHFLEKSFIYSAKEQEEEKSSKLITDDSACDKVE